jgi:hypothetical protein
MNPVHRGKVEQGKKIYDNPSRYLVQLSKLEGKRFEEVIRKEKSKRSLGQNSYYWGVVVEILRDRFGYEEDEAKEVHIGLKLLFLRTHKGEALESVRSTTKLNTAEFEDYLEKIRRWASKEHGIYIPLPNEVEAA